MDLKYAIPLKSELYAPTNKTYNKLRRCKVLLFSHILAKDYPRYANKSYDEKYEFARDMERSCYHAAIDKAFAENIHAVWSNPCFDGLYQNICYSVASNLDKESMVGSSYLGDNILNGKIMVSKLGYLTSREMCPQRYVEYDDKISKRSNSAITLKTTELYKCYKCKKTQCTLENVVNRSIDEGTSLVVKCTFCGASWGG